MQLHKIGRMLAIGGALMLAFGASALPAMGAQSSDVAPHPLLAPSPRPTLKPVSRSRGSGAELAPATGHLTGTIIDLTSGAPATGVKIHVGSTIVTSDANGNYDAWLPGGTYTVSLALTEEQGTPAQDQATVKIIVDQTAILHLSFYGVAAPTAAAASANTVPEPAISTPLPATPAPEIPIAQNNTGTSPSVPQAAPRLPRTGETDSTAWIWISLGAVLLFGGLGLEYLRARRAWRLAAAGGRAQRPASGYDNARLLAKLLTPGGAARDQKAERDLLLTALLNAHNKKGEREE